MKETKSEEFDPTCTDEIELSEFIDPGTCHCSAVVMDLD
jgi:hypothetical protein